MVAIQQQEAPLSLSGLEEAALGEALFEEAYLLAEQAFRAGYRRAESGRSEEAVDSYRKALSLEKDFPNTWYNLGVALYSLERYEEALEAYDQAISCRGDFAAARYNRDLTLVMLHKFSEAQQAFEVAYPHRARMQDGGARFYTQWATLYLAEAYDAVPRQDVIAFEAVVLKYLDILEKAQQDGMGHVVEEALAQFKSAAAPDATQKDTGERVAIEELELFIRLMRIKDPMERWWAIGKAVSNRWPKGDSVRQAVREMRR